MMTKSASAAKATADKGAGCGVKDANDVVWFDPNCTWHEVVKYDDEGNIEFYEYHDHGNLPEAAARPSQAYRTGGAYGGDLPCFQVDEQNCLSGPFDEVITPSGEYQSSFRYR